jgi:hypothetical protein
MNIPNICRGKEPVLECLFHEICVQFPVIQLCENTNMFIHYLTVPAFDAKRADSSVLLLDLNEQWV